MGGIARVACAAGADDVADGEASGDVGETGADGGDAVVGVGAGAQPLTAPVSERQAIASSLISLMTGQ
jgi:hypothetical protein